MQTTPQPVEPDIRSTGRTRDPVRILLVLVAAGLGLVLIATLFGVGRPSNQTPAIAGASAAPSAGQATTKSDDRRTGAFSREITITAIDGDQVTLATADGWKRTITVTSATKVRKGGADVTVAALEVGDEVRLRQQRDSEGAYTVTAIVVPTPVTGGTVAAVDADSIDLKRRDGETESVRVTSATTFTVGKEAGTKADVVVGARVAIEGTVDGGTFTAGAVHIRLEQVSGQVTATTSSTITLSKRNGTTVTVHVDGDTDYRVRGNGAATATIADITVGQRVNARGTLRSDGAIDAVRVDARKAKDTPKSTPTPGG